VADEDDQQQVQIFMPPDQMAGVWANFAQVSHSEHEFTLDFVRIQYGSEPLTGVVVSRISVSPLFVTQLIDALRDNWQKFADKAMPREVNRDDESQD
jgi:hypothetical protein